MILNLKRNFKFLLLCQLAAGLLLSLTFNQSYAAKETWPDDVVTADAKAIGRVLMARGEVLARYYNKKLRVLERRSVIYEGDTIITAAKTRAQIRFVDGAVLSLLSNTTFSVDEYNYAKAAGDKNVSALTLVQGGFRKISGKIAHESRENYSVKTNIATMGVRGTYWSAILVPETKQQVGEVDIPVPSMAAPNVTAPELNVAKHADEEMIVADHGHATEAISDLPAPWVLSGDGYLGGAIGQDTIKSELVLGVFKNPGAPEANVVGAGGITFTPVATSANPNPQTTIVNIGQSAVVKADGSAKVFNYHVKALSTTGDEVEAPNEQPATDQNQAETTQQEQKQQDTAAQSQQSDQQEQRQEEQQESALEDGLESSVDASVEQKEQALERDEQKEQTFEQQSTERAKEAEALTAAEEFNQIINEVLEDEVADADLGNIRTTTVGELDNLTPFLDTLEDVSKLGTVDSFLSDSEKEAFAASELYGFAANRQSEVGLVAGKAIIGNDKTDPVFINDTSVDTANQVLRKGDVSAVTGPSSITFGSSEYTASFGAWNATNAAQALLNTVSDSRLSVGRLGNDVWWALAKPAANPSGTATFSGNVSSFGTNVIIDSMNFNVDFGNTLNPVTGGNFVMRSGEGFSKTWTSNQNLTGSMDPNYFIKFNDVAGQVVDSAGTDSFSGNWNAIVTGSSNNVGDLGAVGGIDLQSDSDPTNRVEAVFGIRKTGP